MKHDINIIVNGNKCKFYYHGGKTFIEAKDGSEYSIQIKNNAWKRILACCSVDGLNIISGEQASEDGPGYVINGFIGHSFDGFRISDTQVAKFVFGKKNKSYAASKQDGSEQNVGVIGIRIYDEMIKPFPSYVCSSSWSGNSFYNNPNTTANPIPQPHITWYATNTNTHTIINSTVMDRMEGGRIQCCCNTLPEPFDMGTIYGHAKESGVVEVEFERGLLILSTDIYYASRQSLIDMGVPLGNEKQVSFPSSFPIKYAKPPVGWKG